MVDLLGGHTPMKVLQATDGMKLERDHVYLIPPGTYFAIEGGTLRLSKPRERHGARMPFDFFLRSLAEECGERAMCAILSGTGADGSLGLKAVKEKGGLVIVQDPEEAAFDGMPRSAIRAGAPISCCRSQRSRKRSSATAVRHMSRRGIRTCHLQTASRKLSQTSLISWRRKPRMISPSTSRARCNAGSSGAWRWRASTAARATCRSCVRMPASASCSPRICSSTSRTSSAIRPPSNSGRKIIPELVRDKHWIDLSAFGCPAAAPGKKPIRSPCCFSSRSRPPNAISSCRCSPPTSRRTASRSPATAGIRNRSRPTWRRLDLLASSPRRTTATGGARIARGGGLHQSEHAGRRAVLAPRSRLLPQSPHLSGPGGAGKILSLFHFALRDGGVLFLGASETVGGFGRFEPISKGHRIYRHIGRSRPGEVEFPRGTNAPGRRSQKPGGADFAAAARPRRASQRVLLETYAPASVLINTKREGLHYFGPIDNYLKVPSGERTGTSSPWRARDCAPSSGQRFSAPDGACAYHRDGGTAEARGPSVAVSIKALPVEGDAEEMLLVSFIDEPRPD